MAVGIWRKIKDFGKKLGRGVATVIRQPAQIYMDYLHSIVQKIPIIGGYADTFRRAADTMLKLTDGDWQGALQALWDDGRLIDDIIKIGSLIATSGIGAGVQAATGLSAGALQQIANFLKAMKKR